MARGAADCRSHMSKSMTPKRLDITVATGERLVSFQTVANSIARMKKPRPYPVTKCQHLVNPALQSPHGFRQRTTFSPKTKPHVLVGYSPRTLAAWRLSRHRPAVRTHLRTSIRYDVATYADWIDARTRTSTRVGGTKVSVKLMGRSVRFGPATSRSMGADGGWWTMPKHDGSRIFPSIDYVAWNRLQRRQVQNIIRSSISAVFSRSSEKREITGLVSTRATSRRPPGNPSGVPESAPPRDDRGAVTTASRAVQSRDNRGAIATAPEPSVEPSLQPSERKSRDALLNGPQSPVVKVMTSRAVSLRATRRLP